MNPTLTKAAANLKRRAANRGRDLPSLWILSDEKRLPDPRAALVSMPRGSALILRHYGAQGREALARRLAQLCRQKGVALLIAGDWRLAAQVGAAGVHLPEHAARRGLPPGGRLWLRAARRLLTVAAHTKLGLRRAGDMRASAAVLAPIFPTASHPSHKGLGAMRSAAMIRTARLPVIALGGVTPTTITALRYTGCVGVAGISFALAA
jgi:thiamine-phosphate pyrophosphorylase